MIKFIDIETVCSRLGIELNPEGRRLVGPCPFHDEHRPSFNVYHDTNTWYCFSCKRGGDAYRLVSSILDDITTWSAFQRWFYDDSTPKRIPVIISPSLESILQLLEDTPSIVLPPSIPVDDPFLTSLGITFATSGVYAGRYIIPIYIQHTLVGFEARDFTSKMVPKTLALPVFIKIHSFLWNIDNIQRGEPIVVVEGIKGAIAVLKFGYPNVVSSFGAALSADQVVLLMMKRPSEVIIAYDGDPAGYSGSRSAIMGMLTWTTTSKVQLPLGTDPWDIDLSIWNTCLSNRQIITVDDLNNMVLCELEYLIS